MRASRITFIGLGLLGCLRLGMLYSALPATVASHFGPSGAADGWMSKDVFALFSLIPLVTTSFIVFVTPWMIANLSPELLNLPNKAYWLVPERKDAALGLFAAAMEWFSVALLVFFFFVYELVFSANLNGTGLANGPFITGLLCFFAFTGLWLVRFYKRFAVPK